MYGYPGMPRFPYGRNPTVIRQKTSRRRGDEVPFRPRPQLSIVQGGRADPSPSSEPSV
jgi:hypothetical protein